MSKAKEHLLNMWHHLVAPEHYDPNRQGVDESECQKVACFPYDDIPEVVRFIRACKDEDEAVKETRRAVR